MKIIEDSSTSEWVLFGDKLNVGATRIAQDPSLGYDVASDYLYVAFEEETDGWP